MREAFTQALRNVRNARAEFQQNEASPGESADAIDWGHGKASPTLDEILQVSRALGVHPLTLVTLACTYLEPRVELDGLLAQVRSELQQRLLPHD